MRVDLGPGRLDRIPKKGDIWVVHRHDQRDQRRIRYRGNLPVEFLHLVGVETFELSHPLLVSRSEWPLLRLRSTPGRTEGRLAHTPIESSCIPRITKELGVLQRSDLCLARFELVRPDV